LQDLDGIGSGFEIGYCHRVSKRVVADQFVILIRADHLSDVGATIGLRDPVS